MNVGFPAIAPHWQARKNYAGSLDWMIHIYNRLLRRATRVPLPGRRRIASVTLKHQRHPFLVRLGSTDMLVLEEIFRTREYGFVERSLNDVRRIVDLGANVGFSLRYWNEVFPGAKMLAIEPDPENFALCRRNVEAAQFLHRVDLVRACVGSRKRQVKLSGNDEWAYQMSDNTSGAGTATEVLTMSELLDRHFPGESVDLLKCDIEGAEAELFSDCSAWIGRIKAIVIELHPPYSSGSFCAHLKQAGGRFELLEHFSEKQCPVLLLRQVESHVEAI